MSLIIDNLESEGYLSGTTLYVETAQITNLDVINITGASTTDYYVTGGTFSGGTLTLNRNGLSDVTITGFTSGSGSGTLTGSGITSKVAFWTDETGLSANTNFHWDDTNERLGIGFSSPSAKVHINNTGSTNSFLVEDSVNPDGSPFVIDSSGNVAIGKTSVTSGTLVDLEVAGKTIGINIGNSNTSFMAGTGVFSYGTGIGINGIGRNDFGTVVGIKGESVFDISADPSTTYYGGEFIAAGQGKDYAVRLSDGTEGVGKFLYSVDANGSANWTSQLSGTSATINGPLTIVGNTSLQSFTGTTGTINGNLTVTGNTIITGSISGGSLNVTSLPTLNNLNTDFLTRNSSTGNIERTTPANSAFYAYGIGFAQSIGNYLT